MIGPRKKTEKPFRFLKGSKDSLTPINGKSINWTPSEILRISLRGTRAVALAVRVEHWTPEGDCTERGDKERSDHFIKEIPLKKSSQKN